MYRGWLVLNGIEIANDARVAAHLTPQVPGNDASVFGPAADCTLAPAQGYTGLAEIPAGATIFNPGLLVPPDGTRKYDPGLGLVGDCWEVSNLCTVCRPKIQWDDSWDGLQSFLFDSIYRPELAPWYSTQVPESTEFGGVWVLDIVGMGPTPVSRTVTELVGPGGSAGPHRDTSRTITVTALLVACTNAGLTYGLEWLACQLRETKARTDSILRFLSAHPGGSDAIALSLVRELHGVVLTKAIDIEESMGAKGHHRQATMYKVSWELTALHPYSYAPPDLVDVIWDSIEVQPVNWVHAADCIRPASCDMPVLFSEECTPEPIELTVDPPPSCGGCLPVGSIDTYVFAVPTTTYPFRCDETVVTVSIVNNASRALTLQAYWRLCNTDIECEDNLWPAQVAGLPPGAQLVLDGISGRAWGYHHGVKHRLSGIVSTPSGAPWMPPVVDRKLCWEFVVLAPGSADFDVTLSLADREA